MGVCEGEWQGGFLVYVVRGTPFSLCFHTLPIGRRRQLQFLSEGEGRTLRFWRETAGLSKCMSALECVCVYVYRSIDGWMGFGLMWLWGALALRSLCFHTLPACRRRKLQCWKFGAFGPFVCWWLRLGTSTRKRPLACLAGPEKGQRVGRLSITGPKSPRLAHTNPPTHPTPPTPTHTHTPQTQGPLPRPRMLLVGSPVRPGRASRSVRAEQSSTAVAWSCSALPRGRGLGYRVQVLGFRNVRTDWIQVREMF